MKKQAKKAKEPAYVAATLRWCNKMRAKKGKKPLKRLPRGFVGDGYSCPCGKATGLFVGHSEWGNDAKEVEDYVCPTPKHKIIPKAVQKFVEAFDSGELPQYELKIS